MIFFLPGSYGAKFFSKVTYVIQPFTSTFKKLMYIWKNNKEPTFLSTTKQVNWLSFMTTITEVCDKPSFHEL